MANALRPALAQSSLLMSRFPDVEDALRVSMEYFVLVGLGDSRLIHPLGCLA